jgi:hypothetical protein
MESVLTIHGRGGDFVLTLVYVTVVLQYCYYYRFEQIRRNRSKMIQISIVKDRIDLIETKNA